MIKQLFKNILWLCRNDLNKKERIAPLKKIECVLKGEDILLVSSRSGRKS